MRLFWGAACRGAPAVALVVFLSGAVALAQQGLSTYEQITVGATAVGIATTTTNPTGRAQMNTCEVRVEAQSVRFREDGTAPPPTVGSPLDDNDTLTLPTNVRARAIRFIRSSGNAIVNVRCYP